MQHYVPCVDLPYIFYIFFARGLRARIAVARLPYVTLARLSCTVERHIRRRACDVGHGPGWVLGLCQVDACSAAAAVARPNDDQPYRRIIFRNISRNTEKKISCFHTQKGFDFWGRSPTTGARSLTGALRLGPTGGLSRPRFFTPCRYSEGVTVVEPQKSTQNFWVFLSAE